MAFLIILCFFLFSPFPTSLSSSFDAPFCDSHDYSALLQFNSSFSLSRAASLSCDEFQSSYPKTASWGDVSNCCLWDGVTCDSMLGHVIGLDLSCSWLQGQLHPNCTLFQLSHLQTLNLAHNYFNGSSISPQFGDLSSLTHLNLSQSVFTAEIPPKISHLSKLTSLDLSWNDQLKLKSSTWGKLILNMTDLRNLVLDDVDMSSITPSSLSMLMNLSSSLVSLRLQRTGLQGNITSDILCLHNLQQLDLSDNNYLNGRLPNSNWSSLLSLFDLSSTDFSGQVSSSIGHLRHLNYLNLAACGFEGQIPPGFSNLTQLTYLNFRFNKFSGEISFLSSLKLVSSLYLGYNKFSGQIPLSISNLKHLTTLDFSTNSLSGEIPNMFGNLSKLEYVSFSENNIGGQLPSLFNLPQLFYFDCSSNKFVGPIPNNICHLPRLNILYLSYNSLNGTIPSGCYSSPSLGRLYLSGNQLTGPIGQFSSHSLMEFDLSNNKFDGPFPESIFSLTNLSFLSLSSNNFSGPVNFNQFSKFNNLSKLDLSNNKFLPLVSFNENVDLPLTNLQFLNLSSCNINNFPKFLLKLPNLGTLSLANNKIQGTIPKWFNDVGNGSLWRLDLSHNFLTSAEHLSMRDIRILDLSFNRLAGNLPIRHFDDIGAFSISNNKLSGDISSLLCNASKLEILNLSHNNFSGLIPQCLVALPNLVVLDLQKNNIAGTMPSSFSKNSALQTLHLNSNQLEGPLPKSLAYCNQLQILDVGDNKLKGTFPNWLEGLPHLQVLILRDNKFHGAITNSNSNYPFPSLRIFDICNNNFCGSLPTAYIKEFRGMMKIENDATESLYMENKYDSLYAFSVKIMMKGNVMELVKILKIFTALDLSNNKFDGEIPEVIGELYSLKGLNLSHNGITGSIPQSMGNLISLEWLDLSWNNLEGEIPSTLTNLNFLSTLNLSQNKLEGIIPSGKQFDTFSKYSFEGNLGLCGVQLAKTCSNDEGRLPEPSSSTFYHDGEFSFGWKPVAWGYGCGMIFGIFMGYIVFSTGKPQWLVRTFGGQSKKQPKKTRNRACASRGRMN